MRVMLLCAGYGKRMLPLTVNTPKPLLLFKGKPIIEYQLISLAKHGFTDIIINLGYLGSKIADYVLDGSKWGLKITYTTEQVPLEWGGGIINALPYLGDEPFLATSGDLVTEYNYGQLRQTAANIFNNTNNNLISHLVLAPNPEFNSKGDFGVDANNIVTFKTDNYYNYAGIAIVKPSIFKKLQPGIIKFMDIMREHISANQVSGELYTGEWYNLGTPEQLYQNKA